MDLKLEHLDSKPILPLLTWNFWKSYIPPPFFRVPYTIKDNNGLYIRVACET